MGDQRGTIGGLGSDAVIDVLSSRSGAEPNIAMLDLGNDLGKHLSYIARLVSMAGSYLVCL
jgi:hypothetical protein